MRKLYRYAFQKMQMIYKKFDFSKIFEKILVQNFFELFLKMVPLYVSEDADHFKPIKKISIFSKIFENFLRP